MDFWREHNPAVAEMGPDKPKVCIASTAWIWVAQSVWHSICQCSPAYSDPACSHALHVVSCEAAHVRAPFDTRLLCRVLQHLSAKTSVVRLPPLIL